MAERLELVLIPQGQPRCWDPCEGRGDGAEQGMGFWKTGCGKQLRDG